MKGIYVLAIIATISLSLVPIMADESDGAFSISYSVNGETIAWGYDYNLNVPDVDVPDGKCFIGWYYNGEIIDPYTYPFEDGIYWLVAGFEDIKSDPTTQNDVPWGTIAVIACVIIVLVIAGIFIRRNL